MDLSALGHSVGVGTGHEPRAAGHAQALDRHGESNPLAFIFRWFAFFAAAVNLTQLTIALRRHAAARHPEPLATRGRNILLVQGGGLGLVFLGLGFLQLAGGFSTFLFFLAPIATSTVVLPARLLLYAFWLACILGIWRPGVVEAAMQLGYIRGRVAATPSTIRLRLSGFFLAMMIAFAFAPAILPAEARSLWAAP